MTTNMSIISKNSFISTKITLAIKINRIKAPLGIFLDNMYMFIRRYFTARIRFQLRHVKVICSYVNTENSFVAMK